MTAREGWSDKHLHKAALVQKVLDQANEYGDETRGLTYEEGIAMQKLQAGKAVSMSDFRYDRALGWDWL